MYLLVSVCLSRCLFVHRITGKVLLWIGMKFSEEVDIVPTEKMIRFLAPNSHRKEFHQEGKFSIIHNWCNIAENLPCLAQ